LGRALAGSSVNEATWNYRRRAVGNFTAIWFGYFPVTPLPGTSTRHVFKPFRKRYAVTEVLSETSAVDRQWISGESPNQKTY
jgi:hypothetical protein